MREPVTVMEDMYPVTSASMSVVSCIKCTKTDLLGLMDENDLVLPNIAWPLLPMPVALVYSKGAERFRLFWPSSWQRHP